MSSRVMKADKLKIWWSKREKALVYEGPGHTGGLLAMYMENVKLLDAYGLRHGIGARIHNPDESDERTLAQELDARGYDLTTLRFTIKKKVTEP